MKTRRSKSKKKLRTSAATTRSRAGPGFAFEDQIGAYLLLHMLMGEALPGTEDAIGSRLQTQTKELGWSIDDLLATSHPNAKAQRRVAVSCKSSTQVSAAGLPKDFVVAAWDQWCKRGKHRMKREQDCLVLATRSRHPAFQLLWADIKNWSGNERLALARINGTTKHRTLFSHIKSPIKKLKRGVKDKELIAFIRHLEVLATDFDLANSHDLRKSVACCRNLLKDGTLTKGRELWLALVSTVRDARLGAGTIELEGLIQDLSRQFPLEDHPSYASSWLALDANTMAYKKTTETRLPNNFAIDRNTEIAAAAAVISHNAVSVFYAESGSGKSALIKAVLDRRFPDCRQVWLNPDQLTTALSESGRATLSLTYPLASVLKASSKPDNVLVIDAAERVPREVQNDAHALVAAVTKGNGGAAPSTWRVVIIGQTEAWAEGAFQAIAGMAEPPNREIRSVSPADIRAALRSAPSLSWAASHDEIVAVLGNLRTLAWVLEAEGRRFKARDVGALASHAAIADHLWRYWTNGKIRLQNLLIRLAEREASFEHSFEVSKLDPDDAAVMDERPPQTPLRLNARNRIEFQHDLAAEFVRFQRLKEIADRPEQWAHYAGRPLWIGALRMLGGLLLRQTVDGRPAWDVAFEKLESQKTTLATDVLLDALCLDPLAEPFLMARADLLLKDRGHLLDRLLKRFQHIATAPAGSNRALADALAVDPAFTLYIDSQFRTPVFARWPAVASFLHAHRERVAALVSPTVAGLCEKWLTSLPTTLPSADPIPFRKELAELALATARALQLEELKRDVIYVGDFGKSIYPAALAAAPDLPADVSAWALEMVRRRPLSGEFKNKLAEHRQRKAREHHERLQTDAAYRELMERRQHLPVFVPSGRALPPWPHGPAGRVDRQFSECCTNSGALVPLMRERPEVAAEVLLAVLIEDTPEEAYSSRALDDGLGLQFNMKSYPTAYWKSPFFAFLQIDANIAREALLTLTGFCSERWIAEGKEHWSGTPPWITVTLPGGAEHQFLGDASVFAWSQTNGIHAGQLYSGLAALERYLTLKIDAGLDVEPELDHLLLAGHSVGLLGVLTNVGKYKPELLRGVLRPLVTHNSIYNWDDQRLEALQYDFAALNWTQQGEMIFNMAREWHNAPYRHKSLREVVAELARADAEFGSFVNEATAKWQTPSDEKRALELRILAALLDNRNYPTDRSGQFVCPPELAREIEAFETAHLPARQILQIPGWCSQILNGGTSLSDAAADTLSSMLDTIDAEAGLDERFKARSRVAVASTLLTLGSAWLGAHAVVRERSWTIVHAALSDIPTTVEQLRATRLGQPDVLSFAAHAVFKWWMETGAPEAQAAVLKIVTSGDKLAVASLFDLAHAHRLELGGRWWRLLYLGLLWSALSMLAPRFGYQANEGVRWIRSLNWLRSRQLDGIVVTRAQIEPLEIAKRLERLERLRWRREFQRRDALRGLPLDRRRTNGLDWDFLAAAFAWLWWEGEKPNPLWNDAGTFQEQRQIILSLWAFEVWLNHRPRADRKDDPVPNQLAYNIVQTIAKMLVQASGPEEAQGLWEPVLKLGAAGHYSVEHFISSWFFETPRLAPVEFAARWRPMIEYALNAPEWSQGEPWYYGQRLLRQMVGFGSEGFLDQYPAFREIVRQMAPYYERWTREHLAREENNVTGLCSFLTSTTGRSLRMKGLEWLQQAVTAQSWYRSAMGNALIAFLNVALAQDAEELRSETAARDAFLALVALLVSKQVPAALALQERAQRLLSSG